MAATTNGEKIDIASAFRGKRVLLTGHTGFKGGWLSIWLNRLGASVTGISLPPETGDNIFQACGIDEIVDHRIGDIRSPENFERAAVGVDADIVIHMAAQSLVRRSYDCPVDTYQTNVVGTAVVLEAARKMPSLQAAIVVTSDKCYENNEWVWGYRENDPMGGADPYSASKGCTELVVSSHRRSYFSGSDGPRLASVRAGNVFGGGDWAQDRLIPDIVRGTLAQTPIHIRNPASIRPWQHVLEPLHGYLMLAAALLGNNASLDEGWNFGPDANGVVDVETLANAIKAAWGFGGPSFVFGKAPDGPHEAGILRLDSTKAASRLGWAPRMDLVQSVKMTVDWYKGHAAGETNMRAFTERQIDQFEEQAKFEQAA